MSLYESIDQSMNQTSHSNRSISHMIDHTLLKNDATHEELARLCQEAVDYKFATVCVNSCNIPFVVKYLSEHQSTNQSTSQSTDQTTDSVVHSSNHQVMPIAVIGFPLGAAATASKAFEARWAAQSGAREIDMVINLGALKNKDYATVLSDVQAVVVACQPCPVKVIIETFSLNEEQKVIACALAKAGGAAFVKTCTGFGGGGATVADIELMRRVVGNEMGVKASGAVRSFDDAMKMIQAGATRIGTSSGVAIAQASQTANSTQTNQNNQSLNHPSNQSINQKPANGQEY